MFLFCWYFDFLCKFKIFNGPWYIDKASFLFYFACFFSCKTKDLRLILPYASYFMQNMYVDSLIENIKAKFFIKFHFIKFMIHLARVANLMIIFSASYVQNAVSTIETVLSVYPSFPQSETIPDARKTEVKLEPVYTHCEPNSAQRDPRARTTTPIPTSTNVSNKTPHHSHSDPRDSGNALRKL